MDGVELLSPIMHKKNEKEYAISHFAARTNWHRIFDYLPNIEESLGDKSSEILREFLNYCLINRFSLNWKRHVIFMKWYEEYKVDSLTDDFRRECLSACTSAWANDYFTNCNFNWIVLHDTKANISVGAKRPVGFHERVRLLNLEIEIDDKSNNLMGIENCEFVFSVCNNWNEIKWKELSLIS